MEPESKMLVIMRGLPGSGKSTLARQLGSSGTIHSTDDYFMQGGDYAFNASLLEEAHTWNLLNARESMRTGVTPVVIDNTNVKAVHMKPYVLSAMEHGYIVRIVEPETAWRFDVDELARRNTHEVSRSTIQRMLDDWDHVDTAGDILSLASRGSHQRDGDGLTLPSDRSAVDSC